MNRKTEKFLLDAMSKDDANWKGIIYFNPKDPRLLVPKRNPGLGWTFNFASIWSWVTLCLILAIAFFFGIYFKKGF